MTRTILVSTAADDGVPEKVPEVSPNPHWSQRSGVGLLGASSSGDFVDTPPK